MAESKSPASSTADRPKPATGGLPTAGRILHVAGGEEAGRVEEAVPAMVVRAYEVGENDPRGWVEGTYRADLVVFNAHGSAATPYTGVFVANNADDAARWLDDQTPRRRDPADASPARRSLVAFWPSR
jgi:hypothetical protein